MKHRNIDYGIREISPTEWEWTIYPKKEDGAIVRRNVTGTREQAEAACKREIDAGLDGHSN